MISEQYRDLLKEAHKEPGWGTSAPNHIEDVCEVIRETKSQSVLDYGCGKGALSEIIDVTNYDPVTYPNKPEPHDLVLCIDVMEHVERGSVDAVLEHIRSLMRRAAFFVISCQPAIKMLADGRNAHITIKSPDWWVEKLMSHGIAVENEWRAEGDKAMMAICKPM